MYKDSIQKEARKAKLEDRSEEIIHNSVQRDRVGKYESYFRKQEFKSPTYL